jgi:aspartyl-tRNA(Asn)/glutamyl-tRNA(Gln) amidotransferase subunit A
MRSDAHSIAPMLCGIPYGLKDVISTAGILTTGQSKILQHNVPSKDAAVEARMKGGGGVLMGKLTTYEFAHGGPSWDLPWPPAMNPWKPGYLPGSTSSGAGAAIAAGLLPAAIGTDTGGSIRMPAAVCGIVGVKPTYGLVSRQGVLPNTFTFDTCGPMARSPSRRRGRTGGRSPACWRPSWRTGCAPSRSALGRGGPRRGPTVRR